MDAFERAPESYDAVITDQTMPGMTGAQLTERLLGLRPDLPVVICTGHSDAIDEQDALQLGARAFLLKPVTRADLAQTMHALIVEGAA